MTTIDAKFSIHNDVPDWIRKEGTCLRRFLVARCREDYTFRCEAFNCEKNTTMQRKLITETLLLTEN